MRTGYSHIELLLDRSGSMHSIKTDMEGGIANFIAEQRAVPGEATFALRQFDDVYETAIAPCDLADVPAVSLIPRGATALLDAMGKAITEAGEYLAAKDESERPEHVFFVVVTDGYENASREWTREKVMELVKQQTEDYGWNFAYLGANQDAIQAGRSMGFANNTNYRADAQGTADVYVAVASAIGSTRSGLGSFTMPENVGDEADATAHD